MLAIRRYGAIVADLSPLVAFTLALLVAIGVTMWFVERPNTLGRTESAVATLRDGVYWAVVTITTVGYGDKTLKTTRGRIIGDRVDADERRAHFDPVHVHCIENDRRPGSGPLSALGRHLAGKHLAVVADSSGPSI